MTQRISIIVLAGLLATACTGEPELPASVESDATLDWMLQNADSYLNDTQWRRAELEASMWRPELPYARKRLSAYALETGGWDFLPEFEVEVESVGENPRRVAIDATQPESLDEWLALGEQAFWYAPMRRDGYLKWLSDKPELWDEVGLQADEEGNLRGVVRYTDPRGDERLAVTCGACHGDQGLAGAANADLDLGHARELFGESAGIDNSLYGTWGPGTVDVTDDGANDALAIPDLWNIEKQTHINHSASVKLSSPAALAIRFETQFIVGQSLIERPQRTLTWALAMYVYSLQSETQPVEPSAVFEERCASCHRADSAFGGGLVDATILNSSPEAANSPLRGTGLYKTTTLLGASRARRFMHDASLSSLEEVLESGHPFGEPLTDDEQDELLEFLNTL